MVAATPETFDSYLPSISLITVSNAIACVETLNQIPILTFLALLISIAIVRNGLGFLRGFWGHACCRRQPLRREHAH